MSFRALGFRACGFRALGLQFGALGFESLACHNNTEMSLSPLFSLCQAPDNACRPGELFDSTLLA